MKNLLQWCIILIMIIFSTACNDDSHLTEASTVKSSNLLFREEIQPYNFKNTFDTAGQLHVELTENYLLSNPNATLIENTIPVVELIANLNPTFLSLRPNNYMSPTSNRIETIVNSGNSAINNLAISTSAKSDLAHFIETLMSYQESDTDFAIVYSYIVDYETSVTLNNLYSELDRRVLLTTSSIARHAMHFSRKRKKPRDRDWDISWGSIVAGGNGSEESMSHAVIMSTVAGINLNIKK